MIKGKRILDQTIQDLQAFLEYEFPKVSNFDILRIRTVDFEGSLENDLGATRFKWKIDDLRKIAEKHGYKFETFECGMTSQTMVQIEK